MLIKSSVPSPVSFLLSSSDVDSPLFGAVHPFESVTVALKSPNAKYSCSDVNWPESGPRVTLSSESLLDADGLTQVW